MSEIILHIFTSVSAIRFVDKPADWHVISIFGKITVKAFYDVLNYSVIITPPLEVGGCWYNKNFEFELNCTSGIRNPKKTHVEYVAWKVLKIQRIGLCYDVNIIEVCGRNKHIININVLSTI